MSQNFVGESENLLEDWNDSMEVWASQEDVDCPECKNRFYICVCEKECECFKCEGEIE